MKKKIIALAVVVAMLAIGTLSSTLAYFIDDEFNKNVMTVGNVDIVQDEDFEDDIVFQPGETVKKEVTVTNVGQGDAYVRTLIAMEDTFDIGARVMLHTFCSCADGTNCAAWNQPDNGSDWLQIMVADQDGKWVEDDGSTWTIYTVGIFDYAAAGLENAILPAGESVQSLAALTFKVDTDVKDYSDNDFYARSGDKYDVLVLSQAVQTGTFASANEAFEAAYGLGEIDYDDDAIVAEWFADYLGVEVRVFDYSNYTGVEFPTWDDQVAA